MELEGFAISTASINLKGKHGPIFNELMKRYKIKGKCSSEKLVNFLYFMYENPQKPSSHKPTKTSKETQPETTNLNYFDCQKLCRKFEKCNEDMNTALNSLSEIDRDNCYVSKYPYDWVTPDGRTVRVCKFMFFTRAFQHDVEYPYPKCIAKAKDRFVDIPKDHIITDPQICWTCVKLRKKTREQKIVKRATGFEPTDNTGAIFKGAT